MLTCAIIAGTLACTSANPHCQAHQDEIAELDRKAIRDLGPRSTWPEKLRQADKLGHYGVLHTCRVADDRNSLGMPRTVSPEVCDFAKKLVRMKVDQAENEYGVIVSTRAFWLYMNVCLEANGKTSIQNLMAPK